MKAAIFTRDKVQQKKWMAVSKWHMKNNLMKIAVIPK